MAESREDRFVQKLSFTDGNFIGAWQCFKKQFAVVRIAKNYAAMNEEVQIANLLLLMGPDSVPIFEQFTFHETEEGKTKTLTNVISMFDRYFEPVKNIIYERVKFNSMCQESKLLHQFITDLQSQADNCEYGAMRDQLVRDRIVVGVSSNKLREYLIDVEDLTLPKCIQKAKQWMSHHSQALQSEDGSRENVDGMSVWKRSVGRKSGDQVAQATGAHQTEIAKQGCPYCRFPSHPRNRCPARNAVCHTCKQKGHWAKSKACKGRQEEVKSVEVDQTAEELGGLFLGSEETA